MPKKITVLSFCYSLSILNKAIVVVVVVVVIGDDKAAATGGRKRKGASETKSGFAVEVENLAIVYKYYYNLQILCIFLGNSHTQIQSHINKPIDNNNDSVRRAGYKQKQLLNEWSADEWGGGANGQQWSSIEISFNWAFCGFNWKLCFLLLLLIEAAAAARCPVPSHNNQSAAAAAAIAL